MTGNVYIKNISNFDISVRSKTLKPGKGDVFPEEVSKQDGVVAYQKKGWLQVEMVKESPDGVSVGIVPEQSSDVKTVDTQPDSGIPTTQPSADNAQQHPRKKKTAHPVQTASGQTV